LARVVHLNDEWHSELAEPRVLQTVWGWLLDSRLYVLMLWALLVYCGSAVLLKSYVATFCSLLP